MKGISCLRSKAWWKYAGMRAIKSFCQALIVGGAGIGTISSVADIGTSFQVLVFTLIQALGMAAASLITSIAGIPEEVSPIADAETVVFAPDAPLFGTDEPEEGVEYDG